MLKDSEARQQATDPRASFIVQAPAGSGKTELLTQRFLRVLSTVTAPEQIVALTFTRKAASEMRERILAALRHAEQQLPTHSAHQEQTNRYAREALNNARRQGWQLLDQPGRLKIITIDALCQTLTQAVPLPEQQTPYARVTESATPLYQEAVRACLAYALQQENLHEPLRCLLSHLDNRQEQVLDLLTSLLASREQWLAVILSAREQSRDGCEQALAAIEQHELQRFIASIPLPCRDELHQLCRRIATIENKTDNERFALVDWQDFDDIQRETAAGIAALLLTKDDRLRKSADHHVGLKKGSCDNDTYYDLKQRSTQLFQVLGETPDFCEALIRVKTLPPPRYDDQQWAVLQAILTLLPLLAAHLQLVFRDKGEVDFTAIAQQAVLALGSDSDPTDLTLHLDNSIHHLMVDEFQDTSIQQFQLLEKLVQGWQPGDGKTLFLVGDPMQSIYRFRQAEVGLFLKARRQGIGPVHLTALELCCNFRSTSTLIDWVNTQFRSIFPGQDDMESGAVSYHPSQAIQAATEDSSVQALQFADKNAEAQALVELIEQELKDYPEQSIAVLVRSRPRLSHLVPLLRARGIPFQGVEIEKLSSLPHLRDVHSLTKALLMPANRLYWLAFLRSPWCGVSLADLHVLASQDRKQPIIQAMSQTDTLTDLSADGRLRIPFLYQVLHKALATRYQHTLTDWLVQTLKNLHGDQVLNDGQRADLEQYWLLLTRFSPNGQLEHPEQFELEFEQLYSQRITPSRLQIMTIHKSKGLEFDCVILPGLGSKAHHPDKPLMRWLTLPAENSEDLVLMSPVQAMSEKQSRLYDYLGDIAADKDRYEQQRLLYVAVTRAKKRLYLVDCQEKIAQGSFRDLLRRCEFAGQTADAVPEEPGLPPAPFLQRLPSHWYANPCQPSPTSGEYVPVIPDQLDEHSRIAGVVMHELLQWVCDRHPATVDELPWPLMGNRLRGLGFSPAEQATLLGQLRQQITAMFADPVGQWLCRAHDREQNEYALLLQDNNTIATRIIDRTFYENGHRWIVDFKTGNDDEASQQNHRNQVNEYARLLHQTDEGAVRCGLYYLANNRWVTWLWPA